MNYVMKDVEIGFDNAHRLIYIRASRTTIPSVSRFIICAQELPEGVYRVSGIVIGEMMGKRIVRKMHNVTMVPPQLICSTRGLLQVLRSLRDVRYYVISVNSSEYICKCGVGSMRTMSEIYRIPISVPFFSFKNMTLCLCLRPGMIFPQIVLLGTYSGTGTLITMAYVSRMLPHFDYATCKRLFSGVWG